MRGFGGNLFSLILAIGPAWMLPAGSTLAQPPVPPSETPGGGVIDFGSPLGFGQETGSRMSLEAQFTVSAEGEPARLFVTATIEPGWHIYSITQPTGGPIRTAIGVDSSDAYRVVGDFQATTKPERDAEAEELFGIPIVETQHGTVTWHAPIKLAANVDPASLTITGKVKAGLCDANSCLPGEDFAFVAKLGPGLPLATESTKTASSNEPAEAATSFDPDFLSVDDENFSLAGAIGLGFLGGLILNLMPCVLPVIGLKILSFVEQSGQNRRHALLLNVWYSLGLVSVFLVLATLAAFLSFGWGQLFSYQGFNITLAAVVFAMGLSFLGVWEVPIPGFVGSGKTGDWAGKEGASGAFAKGVLTTVLATPCSAPFLAPAVGWAVAQPPVWTYAVFTSAGIGMASPYLAIGAFPGLIRFLPKPGAWMETFKEMMGFVLLGTVVFILTFIPWAYVVPTIGLLFGVWAACWWVGRTPATVDFGVKLRAWLTAVTIIGLIWLVTFEWLLGVMTRRYELAVRTAGAAQTTRENELPWQPFTRPLFEELIGSRKTVMVDFTADWCLTCKSLEAWVLNTAEVKQAVEANDVATLKADWTNREPEVTRLLEQLGSKQVPTLAIFPAGNPNSPVRLRGGYTIQKVVAALKKARGAGGTADFPE